LFFVFFFNRVFSFGFWFLVLLLFVFIFAFLMRDRDGVDLNGSGCGEELGGKEGRETVIRIYYVEIFFK